VLRRNFLSRAAGFDLAAFERPRVLAAADPRDWPVRQPLLWV
jgi:hypothetical protein